MNHPVDMADGFDDSFSCVSLTLNAPDVVTVAGTLLGLVVACDYANNDLTKLYCYDSLLPATLGTFEPSTCATTSIGASSNISTGMNGMAWDATTETMFAVNDTELFTVDLATGASTLIGTITNETVTLAIGFNEDGHLFGYGNSDVLLAIDKKTAVGTVIGPLGFDANFEQAMDFDHSDGTCYIFAFNMTTLQGELRTCNTATGATTLIGAIGSTTNPGEFNLWSSGSIRTPDAGIFTDGFESGDTSGWSGSVP